MHIVSFGSEAAYHGRRIYRRPLAAQSTLLDFTGLDHDTMRRHKGMVTGPTTPSAPLSQGPDNAVIIRKGYSIGQKGAKCD